MASGDADQSHFKLSEDAYNQILCVRDLINTMAELAMLVGPQKRVELDAEALSTTLFMAATMMVPDMTYCPVFHRKEG